MGLRSLNREIKDLNRFREIITIVVKQGFLDLVSKARLTKHATVKARFKQKAAETTPQRVRETLEKLGATFVKLGQVLSLRPDLVPHEYCEEFKKLQDDVSPLSYPVVKGLVESELKQPLTKVFKTFDHEPLAAASVAQVHKAVLKTGEVVAVKVQRPGVRDVMERDIDIMTYIAVHIDHSRYRALQAGGIVAEFKRYTENELDLTFELRNIKRFRDAFKDDPEIIIPEPHESLSTKDVLVMELLKGTRISDKETLEREGYDLPGLARIGMNAVFKQIFTHGFFHGDPHPGNLLALRRGKRQVVGVLDFGIVGFIDDDTRLRFLELLDAIFRKDVRGVVHVLLRLGTRLPGCDPAELEQALTPIILEYHDASLQEERITMLVYKLINTGIRHSIQIPSSVVLVAKALVTMEGTTSWLDPSLNLTREAEPLLQDYLRKRYAPARLKEETLRDARELQDLARDLPVAADTIMAKIKEGKVVLALDSQEFARAERDYDLETSRKALALTAGAFFIGSSLIAALATELDVLGLPLWQLGFGLFLVTLGMLILVTIKTHKYSNPHQ